MVKLWDSIITPELMPVDCDHNIIKTNDCRFRAIAVLSFPLYSFTTKTLKIRGKFGRKNVPVGTVIRYDGRSS